MFAINGFGRIGRSILRAYFEGSYHNNFEINAVNCGFGDIEQYVHLLKYDSVHGKFLDVEIVKENIAKIKGKEIKFIFETDPKKIDWKSFGVKTVIEATGRFTTRNSAALHLESGAENVIITAPAKDKVDATIIYGVNEKELVALAPYKNTIISAGSCTTNCLAPVLKVFLDNNIEILSGFMTTVHAYTSDQNLVDGMHNDPRRARAAALSMIPSSTGAAKAIELVLPSLKGKLDGAAVRVPISNVSMVDLKLAIGNTLNEKDINNMMKNAAEKSMKNVLEYETEPLVSSDFNHNPHSSIFDSTQTKVVSDGKFVRVVSWYDNEWGFSNRVLDILQLLNYAD